MKKLLITLLLGATLLGCGTSKKENVLRIGASPIPHSEILNFIKEDLKKKG